MNISFSFRFNLKFDDDDDDDDGDGDDDDGDGDGGDDDDDDDGDDDDGDDDMNLHERNDRLTDSNQSHPGFKPNTKCIGPPIANFIFFLLGLSLLAGLRFFLVSWRLEISASIILAAKIYGTCQLL